MSFTFRAKSLRWRQVTAAVAGTLTLTLTSWIAPAQADPFRSQNPRQVGAKTEEAFRALFEQGNYQQAAQLLQNAETNEPLGYALKASLSYVDGNWNAMGDNARLTRESAERLVQTDPLRGNIYIAAGLFLEGAHSLSTQGTVRATPEVLGKLQQVFRHLNQAERIAPNDPELNLLKGYMDLMLAVNLPFANPQQAIDRLENYAGPEYLAQRGLAIAYRDLDRPAEALTAVNTALQQTPNNPELLYLKAQILRKQGNGDESLRFFRQALAKKAQLPRTIVRQIAWEQCRTTIDIQGRQRDCSEVADRAIQTNGQ
ncbi:Sll0314/Alr1548 family TPR repeat-containing protein [Leptolyngbya ohadii]|uniref:Sll0314/Alr1548 family TPR repeat-containing protein n=1 Tax=Leptolyngbya ohadii TaxID=1962290 RepID=UPI000B5A0ACC|nr:Sll0314/Alr1548 family TPR repeat-containing protein [Leptolyngbya ohadii]